MAAPIAWPDHPLAVSGGEILATRILPLMGHNARDFARAAAECRGWRAACRAAVPALSLYRETALRLMGDEMLDSVAWSTCGKFVASTIYGQDSPPRILIWRASTGALVNEWALATPATAVPPDILENPYGFSVTFSRDSTRVLTLVDRSENFAVWSVPDGLLLAVNRDDPYDPDYDHFQRPDFGVPDSASMGIVGFASCDAAAVYLWDIPPPPPEGGDTRPRLRSRVDLAPGDYLNSTLAFSFSPDGSKFVAVFFGFAYVYDVASLTRLGAFTFSVDFQHATWALDSRHVLVSRDEGGRVFDSSRPEEEPFVVTVDVGPYERQHTRFCDWSPSGASYFALRLEAEPDTFVMEERRAADGSLIRAINLGPGLNIYSVMCVSPDLHALLVYNFRHVSARVLVFD